MVSGRWLACLCLLLLTTPVFATKSELKSARSIAVGSSPVLVTIADFNNDGVLDIATLDDGTLFEVSVLIGNGGGKYQAAVEYLTTCGYDTGLSSGDFDGDGFVDLAVACSGNELILLFGNGDGTFRTATTKVLAVAPSSIVSGDFNGDGKLDLALAGSGSSSQYEVDVLLANGNGTFNEQLYPVGRAQKLAAGDLNGDGCLDLIVTSLDPYIGVLLSNCDGTFAPLIKFPISASANYIALGDINSDGILDAIASLSDLSVIVMLGTGNGQLHKPLTIENGFFSGPVLEDVNRDGHLDLVQVDGSNDVMVLQGNGDGTFVDPAIYPIAGAGFAIATADLDGDGYGDLAVATDAGGGAVALLLNAGSGIPVTVSTTALPFGAEAIGVSSSPQAIKVTNSGVTTLTISSVTVAGDFVFKNFCPAQILPNESCNINVVFRPRAAGNRNGVISINDNAIGSPQKIQLTGTGLD